MTPKRTLHMVTRIPGIAGPASFQRRFSHGLLERDIQVEYGWPESAATDAVMVIGGTRQLGQLQRVKRAGIPVIQRLNGMNWIQRRRFTGLGHLLRAELNNLLLRFVRRRADVIVYQSRFAQDWWEREAGVAKGKAFVVHNGVPLDRYSPDGLEKPPKDHIKVAVIEGRFGGGYEVGLDWALQLAEGVGKALRRDIQIVAAGAVENSVKDRYGDSIHWLGVVQPESIPGLHRGAHFLFAADLHPACPNSVLEAMACGNPVAAFATGAIPELVDKASGAVVPYGADSWRLEPPNVQALVEAAIPLVERQNQYRRAARERAERDFGLDRMVQGYLDALGWG